MEKFNSEKSKNMLEELNRKIDKLREYEIENCDEIPMSIQMKPYLFDFSPEEKNHYSISSTKNSLIQITQ